MRIRSSMELSKELNHVEMVASRDLAQSGQAVEKIMSKWPNERGIFVQLQRLADYIAKTRSELSALRPDQVKYDVLPKATDELDAIVEATASATHRIMDAADTIMDIAGRIDPADSDKVMTAVTSIYEACTFQDITGQRVTKVVNMLKVIEGQLDKMIHAMGDLGNINTENLIKPNQEDVPTSQEDIDALFASTVPSAGGSQLHGPALPGQGKTQAEVDALFGGE